MVRVILRSIGLGVTALLTLSGCAESAEVGAGVVGVRESEDVAPSEPAAVEEEGGAGQAAEGAVVVEDGRFDKIKAREVSMGFSKSIRSWDEAFLGPHGSPIARSMVMVLVGHDLMELWQAGTPSAMREDEWNELMSTAVALTSDPARDSDAARKHDYEVLRSEVFPEVITVINAEYKALFTMPDPPSSEIPHTQLVIGGEATQSDSEVQITVREGRWVEEYDLASFHVEACVQETYEDLPDYYSFHSVDWTLTTDRRDGDSTLQNPQDLPELGKKRDLYLGECDEGWVIIDTRGGTPTGLVFEKVPYRNTFEWTVAPAE